MTKLKELEKRLKNEPDNLGLRVVVAGALHSAGRRSDAIELYRSVALAYRDRGRPQQAITVCRSILELAPDDRACRDLLAALVASQPAADELAPPHRRSEPLTRPSGDLTPLPPPLAYHEADPTRNTRHPRSASDLPQSLQDELASYPRIAGIANAARQISASLIAASRQVDEPDDADAETETDAETDAERERDTRRLPRITADEITGPPLTASAPDGDDEPTLPSSVPEARIDDDKTAPRARPNRGLP